MAHRLVDPLQGVNIGDGVVHAEMSGLMAWAVAMLSWVKLVRFKMWMTTSSTGTSNTDYEGE